MSDFEDEIREYIFNNDIQNISDTLAEIYKSNLISTLFCKSLFIPVIRHAFDNEQLDECIHIYTSLISEMYDYCIKNDSIHRGERVFAQSSALVEDTMKALYDNPVNTKKYEFNLNEGDLDTLFNLIAILTGACHSMMLLDNELHVYNSRADAYVHQIPSILECCGYEANPTTEKITQNVINVCNLIVDSKSFTMYNGEQLIFSLLDYMTKNRTSMEEVAYSLSKLVQRNLDVKLLCPYRISAPTNILAEKAASEPSPNKTVIRALLDVSCLLLKNYSQTPWLDDLIQVASIDDSLSILQLRAELLSNAINHIEFISSQAEDMMIDQSTNGFEKQDLDAVYNCQVINKTIMDQVGPLVNELSSLHATDDACYHLIFKLKEIAIYSENADPLIFCEPYMREIVELVTRSLDTDLDLAQCICALFGYNLPSFVASYLKYALPYAVLQTEDNYTLDNVAAALNTDARTMCKENVDHILVPLMMEEDRNIRNRGYKKVQKVCKNLTAQNDLATSNATKITIILAMNLGKPGLGEKSLSAIQEMMTLLKLKSMTVAGYLSQLFVAILSKITEFISQKKLQSQTIEEPYALDALAEIIDLMESEVGHHALHLINAFQSINELQDMKAKVLILWQKFISAISVEALQTHLNGIIKGLVQLISTSDHTIRISASEIINELLITNARITVPFYSDLPLLPEFSELGQVRQHVLKTLDQQRPPVDNRSQLLQQLISILSKLREPDELAISSKLEKLSEFITENPHLALPRDILYSHLLYLIRKYSNHKEISYSAAVCLGKVGAISPSLVDVKILDDRCIVQDNFKEKVENRNFIGALLIHHIIPAYTATCNEEIRQYMQYSIQELLKCAGFVQLTKMETSPEFKYSYESWKKLPPLTQEFLTPFLHSSYEIGYPDVTIDSPIFPQAQNFPDWLEKWYRHLANRCQIMDAKNLFKALVPMVMCNLIDVTAYIIPYLVLHSILSCTGDVVYSIKEEMLHVLNTNAEPDDKSNRGKMNYQALQVVVSVTAYCRQWMNNIRADVTKKSQLQRVADFLDNFPDKTMAIASYNSKAYPQALMHLETYIKHNLGDNLQADPEALKYLRLTLAQVDDRVGLALLLEMHVNVMGLDEEITRFEAAGRWQDAEVLYNSKIRINPADISGYTGYMECLSKWGAYDNIPSLTDRLSEKCPTVAPLLNSFKIDAAWRLGQWDVLEKATKLPIEKTPEAFIGSILSKLRTNQYLEAGCYLEEARYNLIETLSKTTESYKKSYPAIFNLQLLQEVENAQTAWESNDPIACIKEYSSSWKSNIKTIASNHQYKINLLQLRKAAFFDIRPLNLDQAKHKMWLDIAKTYRKAGNEVTSLKAVKTAERIAENKSHNEKARWYWAFGLKNDAVLLLNSSNNLNPANVARAKRDTIDPDDALTLAKLYKEDSTPFEKAQYTFDAVRNYCLASCRKQEKLERANYNLASFYRKRYCTNPELTDMKIRATGYVVRTSVKCLQAGSKYYYSTMSHLLNSWFELVTLLKETDSKHVQYQDLMASLVDANKTMMTAVDSVPAYQFSLVFTRLVSHLADENEDVAKCLASIIMKVFYSYPRTYIWFLLNALESPVPLIRDRVARIIKRIQAKPSASQPKITIITQQAQYFIALLKKLADYKVDERESRINLLRVPGLVELTQNRDFELYVPTESSLYPTLPEMANKGNVFPERLPMIRRVGPEVLVMTSLQRPKKIVIYGSDGKPYGFLVKSQDDLRKDARTMEMNYMINNFLKRNVEARDHGLHIRTYAVIPLGVKWGLIQWIDNIRALKSIVNKLWEEQGCETTPRLTHRWGTMSSSTPAEKMNRYNNIIKACPAVFHKWFLRTFPEPNKWLTSRTNYIKTLAVMSIVGFFIGLGDRHAENILFDETSGDCMHVDLNMIFDTGKNLGVPEKVPFRLTKNLVDAMGVLSYHGTFTKSCQITMDVLLENEEALMGIFQTLVNDEVSFALYSQEEREARRDEEEVMRRINIMEEKINYYMEKNMGYIKKEEEHLGEILEEKDPNCQKQDTLRPSRKIQMKAVENMKKKFEVKRGEEADHRVRELIAEAMAPVNLCDMFGGWAPFL